VYVLRFLDKAGLPGSDRVTAGRRRVLFPCLVVLRCTGQPASFVTASPFKPTPTKLNNGEPGATVISVFHLPYTDFSLFAQKNRTTIQCNATNHPYSLILTSTYPGQNLMTPTFPEVARQPIPLLPVEALGRIPRPRPFKHKSMTQSTSCETISPKL